MANKKARPAPMTNEKALGILMELYQAEGKKMLTDTDDPNLMSALDRGICALDNAGKQSEAEKTIEKIKVLFATPWKGCEETSSYYTSGVTAGLNEARHMILKILEGDPHENTKNK